MQMEATTVSWSLCEAQLSAPPISFSKTHHFFLSFFFSISSQSPHSATLSSHGNGRNNNHLCSFPFFLLIFFFFLNHLSLNTTSHPIYMHIASIFFIAKIGYGNLSFMKKKMLSHRIHFPTFRTSLSYSYTHPVDSTNLKMTPKQLTVHLGIATCPWIFSYVQLPLPIYAL